MMKFLAAAIVLCLSPRLCAQTADSASERTRVTFRLSAGPAIPVGDFGGAETAAARTGGAASAEIAVGASTSWISGITLAYNPSKEGDAIPDDWEISVDPWWTLWPMSGIRWRTDASPGVAFSLTGQIGLFIGRSPAIVIHSPVGDATASSDRSLAVSAGLAGEISLSDRFALGIRCLYAKPEYDVTVTDLGLTTTETESQTTSLLVLSFGLSL